MASSKKVKNDTTGASAHDPQSSSRTSDSQPRKRRKTALMPQDGIVSGESVSPKRRRSRANAMPAQSNAAAISLSSEAIGDYDVAEKSSAHNHDVRLVEPVAFATNGAVAAALPAPTLRVPAWPDWLRRVNWRSTATFLLILAATIVLGMSIAYIAASSKPLIAAGVIVGLALAIRFVTQPFYALMLTMVFIPMDAFDDYFPPSLSAVKLMSIVTIGCFAVYWLVFSRNKRLLQGTMPKLILLFLMLGLVGTFFAYYPEDSLDAVSRFFRLFLLTILVQNLVDTPRRARWLILALMIAVCISAAVGLRDLMTTHLKNFRPMGLTQQPNKFGNDTAQMAPVAIALLWSARSRLARVLCAGAAALLITGVVISLSRGSLVALLAVMPLLLWRLGGRWRIQIFAGIAIALIVAFPFIPSRYYARFSTLDDPTEDFSVMRRETYLIFAQREFMNHPFIGIGLKNFEQLYIQSEYRILLDEGDKTKGRPAHNMYMHLTVETGLFGIGLFASMLLWAWYDLRRSQKGFAAQGDIVSLRLTQGLEMSFLCFLFLCLFGSRQYEEFPWLIFALSSALLRLSRVPSGSLAEGDQHENLQVPAPSFAGS